jgi:two-component system, NarL family, response regulator YdfI
VIDVLVLSPFASVRAGLRALLAVRCEVNVAGEARDVETLRYLLGQHRADVILSDATGGDVESAVALALEHQLALVALSDYAEDAEVMLQLAHSGWALLQRSADGDAIFAAVQCAAAGLVAIDPVHVAELIPGRGRHSHVPLESGEGDAPLTPREREVLQLMTQGLPNKTIAGRLNVSLSTAKFHVASILTKLDASSRTEAVTIGARRGLVSL